MKYSKILWISAIAMMGLSSCVNEENSAYENGKGKMQINVDLLQPKSTRAVETKDFPVNILDANGNPLEDHQYAKVTDVPKLIQLPVGQYTAESYSPGEFQKIMDKPYYKGSEVFYIRENMNTYVDVTCRMANGSFEVKFSDSFHDVFSRGWQISINDGVETAITYSSLEDNLPLPKKYLRFEEETSQIFVNFIGVTNEGSRITMSNTLTKEQASEQYDDDNAFFSGGDAIVLNFTPVESTEGDVTGVTLTANIQFEESEETFTLEVEDNNTSGGEEGGDTPGGNEGDDDELTINLDLPEPIEIPYLGAARVDKTKGDTQITTVSGIKSIVVSIESTSGDMIKSLGQLKDQYNVDFIKGVEIVGNKDVENLFQNKLNQPLSVPNVGDLSYNFPIGNFFSFLQILNGTHVFHLRVEDVNGNIKTGDVTITVTQ